MTAKLNQLNLIDRLTNANTVCSDCGRKYGKYSVGCSSVWQGECQVCGETKGVTETRDYGYLAKGIAEEKAKLLVTSDYADIYGGQIDADLVEDKAPYEQGEIACMFTEDEVSALADMLLYVANQEEYELDEHCLSVSEKVRDLFEDYCVKYELSPAMKAYIAKYGLLDYSSEVEQARWEGFRDAFEVAHNEK